MTDTNEEQPVTDRRVVSRDGKIFSFEELRKGDLFTLLPPPGEEDCIPTEGLYLKALSDPYLQTINGASVWTIQTEEAS